MECKNKVPGTLFLLREEEYINVMKTELLDEAKQPKINA